jgi:hypothetical protein
VLDLLIIVAAIAAAIAYSIERRKVREEIAHLRTLLAQEYAKPGRL